MEKNQVKNSVEKKSFSDAISNFIIKNRVFLLSLLVIIIIGGIGSVVYIFVGESMAQTAFTELDKIEANLSDANEAETLVMLEEFASKNSSNAAGSRAYMLIADLYFSKENWESAKNAYENAAKANPRAYTAPLNYYNAAISAEQLDDIPSAIEFLKKSIAIEDFALAPRAYFTLGRLEDTQGNFAVAYEYYNTVFEKYPSDEWAKLAKSRALVLESEGKIEQE